jgi:hypothetical protein
MKRTIPLIFVLTLSVPALAQEAGPPADAGRAPAEPAADAPAAPPAPIVVPPIAPQAPGAPQGAQGLSPYTPVPGAPPPDGPRPVIPMPAKQARENALNIIRDFDGKVEALKERVGTALGLNARNALRDYETAREVVRDRADELAGSNPTDVERSRLNAAIQEMSNAYRLLETSAMPPTR